MAMEIVQLDQLLTPLFCQCAASGFSHTISLSQITTEVDDGSTWAEWADSFLFYALPYPFSSQGLSRRPIEMKYKSHIPFRSYRQS